MTAYCLYYKSGYKEKYRILVIIWHYGVFQLVLSTTIRSYSEQIWGLKYRILLYIMKSFPSNMEAYVVLYKAIINILLKAYY